MNTFYKKLTEFGSLVYSSSRRKKLDMSHYFTVLHPGHPIIKNSEKESPEIEFNDTCPQAVKTEVVALWNRVFGKKSA